MTASGPPCISCNIYIYGINAIQEAKKSLAPPILNIQFGRYSISHVTSSFLNISRTVIDTAKFLILY